MLERLLIVGAITALILAGWLLARGRQRRRLRALAASRLFAGLVPSGHPAIVAFTLPTCAECRSRQAPALRRLQAELGGAAHIETLSAEAYPELVTRLGILTVPATVVLDAAGVVRSLNQGFADEARLRQQVHEISASVA